MFGFPLFSAVVLHDFVLVHITAYVSVGEHMYAYSTYSIAIPASSILTVPVCVVLGTEMMDSQLMGEFEAESKDLEADSWTFTVDKKYVKGLKKEVVKRQDVIYGRRATLPIPLIPSYVPILCFSQTIYLRSYNIHFKLHYTTTLPRPYCFCQM